MKDLRQQFDTNNLYQIITSLPEQFTSAYQSTTVQIEKNTKKIIFCGLGGSALPANLLKTLLTVTKSQFNIPIKIWRDYSLPHIVDNSWCGFFSSYSGNTEEVLSALKEAEKKKLKQIIVMAHGGKLKKLAIQKKYPFIEIPDFAQPRMSYGYYIGALLKIFVNSGLLPFNEPSLEAAVKKTVSLNSQIQTNAQRLAKSLKNKIPIIYTSNVWKYVAMVWKINLNENSKIPSYWNVFPEMNHNEMVGYTNILGNFKIIILRDPDENNRTLKRIETFQNIFKDKLDVEIINLGKGSPCFKLISILMLGLWTSYYLALLYHINPTPVDLVEKFKKLLEE